MRSIRLCTSWSASKWLVHLDPESRLAWIEFLCYVDAYGSIGTVRASSHARMAGAFDISEDAFTAMFEAAVDAGLVEEGASYWTVSNWSDYQYEED